MFAKFAIIAALAGSATAAPISQTVSALPANVTDPAGWASGYLEEYTAYHARFEALQCGSHITENKKDEFFASCCEPLLFNQTLSESRPAQCIPSKEAASSASAAVATQTAINSAADYAFVGAASYVVDIVAKITESATESLNTVTFVDAYQTVTMPLLVNPTGTVSEAAAATATYVAPVEVSSESPKSTAVAPSSTAEAPKETYVAPSSTSEAPKETYVAPTSTYVAPTSTYVAPVQTTPAASTGGNWNDGGHATYYMQNGNPGACGGYASESEHVIALPYNWYGGNGGSASGHCGQWVEIKRTSNGATTTAKVADLCPSCTGNGNSLDLSYGAFTAIATTDEGQVDISWRFL